MFSRLIRFFIKNPLSRRLIFLVFSLSLFLTIVATVIITVTDNQNEITQLEKRFELIKNVEVPNLTNSVWLLNKDQIASQLNGILAFQDITYEQLIISGGETITLGQPVEVKNSYTETYFIEHTQGNTTYSLGELTVVADLQKIHQRVISRLFRNLFTSAVQIFVLVLIILVFISRLFVQPLMQIVNFTDQLNLDQLDKPLVIKKSRLAPQNDELDLVAKKINEMQLRMMADVEEQRELSDALIESEKKYREIFNATNEAIVIQDADTGKILQVNQSMLHMFGFSSESEVIGLSVADISSNKAAFSQENADRMIEKAKGEGTQIFEWQTKKKNGELFWTELSLRKAEINGIDRIIAVVRDISESKRNLKLLQIQYAELQKQRQALEVAESKLRELNQDLEYKVEKRTEQLAELNTELESFSYSVAHDLKTPLRSINAYTTVLLSDLKEKLDSNATGYLNKIVTSTQKMTDLIEDLLKLSRVTRSEIVIEKIDLSPLAGEILENLQNTEPDRKVSISIEPKLPAMADLNLITIALDNLLRNAWKFTSKIEDAKIEVGYEQKQNQTVFFITDNGVGFDGNLATTMFSPFVRLHSSTEFEGTGIGLSITKKIIQRHHGEIWAEGKIGQGAKFFFTLPEFE